MSDNQKRSKPKLISVYTGNLIPVEDHRTDAQRKDRLSFERRVKFIGCVVVVSLFAISILSFLIKIYWFS